MTCSSCVHNIELNLAKKTGIIDVTVNLASSRGRIKYEPETIGVRDIVQLVNVSLTGWLYFICIKLVVFHGILIKCLSHYCRDCYFY